jgi:hypothetical protein
MSYVTLRRSICILLHVNLLNSNVDLSLVELSLKIYMREILWLVFHFLKNHSIIDKAEKAEVQYFKFFYFELKIPLHNWFFANTVLLLKMVSFRLCF